MFRKHYKEAVNDIKPDAAFVESVIQNAKRKKPPLYARYARYAAAAAAAVVVVSAAVISMPIWQKVTDKADGVIIEEAVSQTSPPSATSDTAQSAAETVPASAPPASSTAPADQIQKKQQPSRSTEARTDTAPNTSNHSYGGFSSAESFSEKETEQADAETQTADEAAEQKTETAENNNTSLRKSVEDSSDYSMSAEDEADNAVMFSKAAETADEELFAAALGAEKIADNDIPTPSGYYCTRAEWNGYTFVNDEGAVIIVSISYGGEDSGPYYSQDGDNIYAGFTSYGLTVDVSASGADMSAVEEIINSLR